MMDLEYLKFVPISYYKRLNQNGESEKARCFIQYIVDTAINQREGRVRTLPDGTRTYTNSIGYYAQSWGHHERGKCIKKKSKGSVTKWIKEFNLMLEKYSSGWGVVNWLNGEKQVLNAPINNYAKKPSERLVNGKCTEKEPLNAEIMGFKKIEKTESERLVNEYLNINDDDGDAKKIQKEFENLYFIYRAYNGSYTGSKEIGLAKYQEIKKELLSKGITYGMLVSSIHLYFMDKRVVKKNGISKFLSNSIYSDYIEKSIKIKINGVWIKGKYLNETFTADDTGKEYTLTLNGFAEYCSRGDVVLLDLKEVG